MFRGFSCCHCLHDLLEQFSVGLCLFPCLLCCFLAYFLRVCSPELCEASFLSAWLLLGRGATTSALGGTLGIVLGYIVSAIANQVLPMFTDGMDITVSPSFNSIVAAFGISVFIGVLFGYLPAKRAARLNPIDALRYD